MKKISAIMLITILCLSLCSCRAYDAGKATYNLAKGLVKAIYDDIVSPDDDTYVNPGMKAEEIAKGVYYAIKSHDNAKLKSFFCEELRKDMKESDFDEIYEFLGGEIETLETDFENDHYAEAGGGAISRGDKCAKSLSIRYVYFSNDKGIRYRISGKGDIYNDFNHEEEGLQILRICRQLEDGTWDYENGYLEIGRILPWDYDY